MKKISILFVLVFWTASAFAQAPEITSAVFDEQTNTLRIDFDSPIWTSSDMFSIGGITLDDDNGGANPDVALNGGVILNTNASDAYIEIQLYFEGNNSTYVGEGDDTLYTWGIDYRCLESIESFEAKENIFMLLREITYLGTDNEANSEIGLADAIPVEYVYSSDVPEIIHAEYDAATNHLILEFDRLIQWDSIEEDLMFFWIDSLGLEHHDPGNGVLDVGEDRNGNGVLDFEKNIILQNISITDGVGSITLDGGLIMNTADAEILEIALLLDNYKAVENLDTDNLGISFPAYTFVDQDYNAVASEDGYNLEFTEDADPLVADSAMYDMAKNELKVYFSGPLSTGYIQIPKFSFEIEEEFITLEAASKPPSISASGGNVKITLLTSDQMIVEGAINSNPGSPVYLIVENYAVLDDLGNGNILCDSVLTSIIPESGNNRAPEVLSVSYDAENNILEVEFDVSIKQNTEDVNIQGFSLLNGSDTISFTSDELGESGDSKLLWIALNPADELAVESATDKEGLLLLVEPFSVLQTPKLNGNWAVTADSAKLITYNIDTTPPLPDYVKYNNSIEKFVLHFSDAMTTEVNFSLITFADLPITGGEVEYGDDPGWLLLGLTTADIAAIDGLPNEDKEAVAVTFADDAFINAEGLGNVDLPPLFVDGDTLSAGSESVIVLVGIGRNFWLMSKEAFPTLDREIPAAIRKIGENCVIYVADDQWRPYSDVDMFGDIITTNYGAVPIIPSEVDAVCDHFEGSGEAYHQVNSIFADGKEELVPETVNILLCDIRDEYNLGRNDTKKGYYIASFFNPNDQKSVWETGGEFNTNELDLIYIDSWPQLFSETDSSNYLYNEEEWRVRKPPDFPVTVFHSIDNAYTKLLCCKVDPWESQWMIEGFASFAEWMIEGEVSFYGAGDPTTPTANSLKNFSTGLKTRIDFYNSYLFMLYFYEKYGGMDLVKMLAVQPAVDMEAINISFQKLLDEGAGTPELQELWANHTAKDVFGNYAVACLLDTTNMDSAAVNPYITCDDRMFQFDNANLYGKVSAKNATILKWDPEKGAPPYNISQEEWSFGYYYFYYNSPTSNPMLSDTSTIKILMPFTEMNMFQILLKNDPVLEFNNPDYYFKYFRYDTITHQTSFNVNPNDGWTPGIEPDDYKTFVIVGVLGGYGKITETCEEISLAQLSVAQSPIIANRFDVYLLVSDLIWGDGSSGGDVPQLIYQFCEAEDTTSYAVLMQSYEFLEPFGYEEDFSLYASYLNLNTPGTYIIKAFFVDLSGEEYWVGPYLFVVENYNPGAGAVFGLDGADFIIEANSYPQSFTLSLRTIESNAAPDAQNQYLYDNSYFAAPPAIEREAIGPAYQIQPEIYLDEPAWVSLPYGDYIGTHSPAELGVYLYRNDSWVYMGGEPAPSAQTIKARAKQLGLMQLQTGPHGAIPLDLLVPDRYALKQNYPNPFNPTTRIDYQLAHAGNTTLRIYDILGREVVTLVDEFQYTGFHSISWDGRSNSGIPVASGVYLYRLESSKYDKTCKMVLLK